jgi:hypothetical protein
VVIVMRHGGPDLGGMQVSGMGGYIVVRWDGTCATLSDGEIVTRARVEPGHARFAWKYIDTSIQDALLRDERIKAARKAQRKHCHGVSLGVRSASCERADAQLNERIVVAVRTGLELPPPDRLP